VANNNFPLQPLVDLSHARLDEAARRLGQLLASEQEGAKRLTLLVEYRNEYHQRFLDAARDGIERDLWANYQAFLGRLDEAIAQQQAALNTSRQRTSDGQRAWLDQRIRAKAFDTLSQRHLAERHRVEGKAEQKSSDEHAARAKPADEADQEAAP
jgi:flagellar FliJ protein